MRKFEEIEEEITQNEVSLGGSPTIDVALLITLKFCKLTLLQTSKAASAMININVLAQLSS